MFLWNRGMEARLQFFHANMHAPFSFQPSSFHPPTLDWLLYLFFTQKPLSPAQKREIGLVWVLVNTYKYSPHKIENCILRLLNTPNIEVPNIDLILSTFTIWKAAEYKVDYIDAYTAAWINTNNLKGIYSYDRDFDKIKVNRKEP